MIHLNDASDGDYKIESSFSGTYYQNEIVTVKRKGSGVSIFNGEFCRKYRYGGFPQIWLTPIEVKKDEL